MQNTINSVMYIPQHKPKFLAHHVI